MIEVTGLASLRAALIRSAGPATITAVTEVTSAAAEDLLKMWKSNARKTAGKHGRPYPNSITMEKRVTFGAVSFDIGPDNSKKQGRMGRGFEFGSVNQPPHLDGTKAAAEVAPKFEHALAAATEVIL